MCDPILVTLLKALKMRPHCNQSSRENATPSSGTFPLSSYKEVTPHTHTHIHTHTHTPHRGGPCVMILNYLDKVDVHRVHRTV